MKNARLWLAIVAQGTFTFAAAQAPGISVFRPDRGFRPTGSYSVADTESVNETNGNVSIRIPLAATSPARNGANFQLALSYNSALFNLATQDLDPGKYILFSGYSPGMSTTVNALVPSDLAATGGWRYSHHYYLEEDVRPCSPDHPHCIKWNLILPDGSSHLLRLDGPGNDPDGTGFSQFGINRKALVDGGLYRSRPCLLHD